MPAVTAGSLEILRDDSHRGQFTKSRKTGLAFSLANRPLTFRENTIKGQTLEKPIRLAVLKIAGVES